MTKIKVEVVAPQGFKEGHIHREFGDVFTTENGAEYVRLGWCKNVETGEVGELIAGVQSITVHNVVVDKLKI